MMMRLGDYDILEDLSLCFRVPHYLFSFDQSQSTLPAFVLNNKEKLGLPQLGLLFPESELLGFVEVQILLLLLNTAKGPGIHDRVWTCESFFGFHDGCL